MIRVALVGVGNCASSLVQGVELYSKTESNGLMRRTVGPYHVADIEFVAAFDIDKNKVGKDLSEAIFTLPNNTIKLSDVPNLNVPVMKGMTHDGISRYTKDFISKADGPSADVAQVLIDNRVDVVVNYLPVGSEEATKWYVEQVLKAGCAFVNCMPVFIASDKTRYWPQRFEKAKVPIIGDDIKSQIGATIIHRMLTRLFESRGCTVDRTYQLNFGGNTDFLNMLDRDRLASKKISKTGSVQSQLRTPLDNHDIHVGPSDYVSWLEDRKFAYIRLEGRNFGGAPVSVELKLEVWDSPNSAGVVIDAIRCAMLAKDRGQFGPVIPPSLCYMKTPPIQCSDEVGNKELDLWLAGLTTY